MKYLLLMIFIGLFTIGILSLYYVKMYGTPDLAKFFYRPSKPEGSQKVEVVDLNPSLTEATTSPEAIFSPIIKLFFHNKQRNPSKSEDCGLVYPVERDDLRPAAQNQEATASGEYALNLLFAGPVEDEISRGYSSPFGSPTANILRSLKVDGETAYVNLADIRKIMPKSNLSCGSAEFISEVGETLRQFGNIKNIIYAINGSPKTFYEWMNLGCNRTNDNCSAIPFK